MTTTSPATAVHDCIIIGGGPAGLSAALVLGRCRRRVLVVDAGRPRNLGVQASHGVLTRDGTSPAEIRRLARQQLKPYDSVSVLDDEVLAVRRTEDGVFQVRTRSHGEVTGKKLLLATGMRDRLPDTPGFRELLGRGVYVCPYCDGWEVRDRKIVAYAPATTGPDFALGLLTWSRDVALVTPGERVNADDRALLSRHGVVLHEEPIASLESSEMGLCAMVLESGARLACDAVFVKFGEVQAAPFAMELGCELTEQNTVATGNGERAGPKGVFVAGDASHDLQLVTIAIAEGSKAACAINTELRRELLD